MRSTRISPFLEISKEERVNSVKIGHRKVDVFSNLRTMSDDDALWVVQSYHPFATWLRRIEADPTIIVDCIRIRSVDRFRSGGGFAEIEVRYQLESDQDRRIKEEIMFRGEAIGVLFVLNCDGEEFTLVTKNPKIPVGRESFPEIPAGMIHNDVRK